MENNKLDNVDELAKSFPAKTVLSEWKNIGGQLIRTTELEKLQKHIKSGKIKTLGRYSCFL